MSEHSFRDSQISQFPALRLLQPLGFAYLSPAEVYAERRAKRRHDAGEGVTRTDADRQWRVRMDKDGE